MKKIHIIGIEGAGTSALATLYHGLGYEVSGSDDGDGFYASVLKEAGIPVSRPFSPGNLPGDADLVVYSTAFTDNPEVVAARKLGIRTLSYPEAVGELTKERMSLLVAGSHGKTTTSAMLAEVLRVGGVEPSAIVGSRVRDWGGSALSGRGRFFVLEADEYQDKLSHYHPFAAILTSVDWDHPDCFPDERSYEDVFRRFVSRIPRHGALIYSADSASVGRVAESASCTRLSYGFHESADFRIIGYGTSGAEGDGGVCSRFSVRHADEDLGEFSLSLPGRHNARNAAATVAMCSFLRIDTDRVREALAGFSGTVRRSEFKGSFRGIPVYDDYAHHPEELRATLAAFREAYPTRRIVAVFHPHTFTRTKALLSDFAQAFDDADRVIVLDIYGSARETEGGVSSADLVAGIGRFTPGKAEHIPTIPEVIDTLKASLDTGDLLLTLGAGDVWRVAEGLVGMGK